MVLVVTDRYETCRAWHGIREECGGVILEVRDKTVRQWCKVQIAPCIKVLLVTSLLHYLQMELRCILMCSISWLTFLRPQS